MNESTQHVLIRALEEIGADYIMWYGNDELSELKFELHGRTHFMQAEGEEGETPYFSFHDQETVPK